MRSPRRRSRELSPDVGASSSRDVGRIRDEVAKGRIGWDGTELVAFRMHLPSEILFENSPEDVLRGNILEWSQALDARLHSEPLDVRVQWLGIDFVHHLLLFGPRSWQRRRHLRRAVVGGPPRTLRRAGGVGPLMRPDASPKAVLRCGRCGRVSAWPDARLQVECGCRARVDLAPPLVREATPADREMAEDIFRREFGGRQLVADGQPVTRIGRNYWFGNEGGVAGAWRGRLPDALHIIALATDPMWQRAGVGSYLAEAELLARRLSLTRIVITISNDNIPRSPSTSAGATGDEVLPGAIAALPQNAGLVGFAAIPIVDEIQLSKDLQA